MGLNDRLKQLIVKNSSEWLERVPAYLGNIAGVVATDVIGIDWARMTNGQEVKVLNRVAPQIFDTKILIGKSKTTPNVWQVINVRETYPEIASSYVQNHAPQHRFPAIDTVWIDRKQITALSVVVSDPDAFTVQIFGGFVPTASGLAVVDNQEMDLTGYIPEAGAYFVNIESDESGGLYIHAGERFPGRELATVADVPMPAAGRVFIASILLFESMDELTNDLIIGAPLVAPSPLNYARRDHSHENMDLQLARAVKSNAHKIYLNTSMM